MTPLEMARKSGRVNTARDHFNWGGDLDLEPLLRSIVVRVIRPHILVHLLKASVSSLNRNTPNHEEDKATSPSKPLEMCEGGGGTQLLSSLDIEFFKLSLTFNPYENARHRVSYCINSRWSLRPTLSDLLIDDNLDTPENAQLIEFRATFDGTAQVHKEKPPRQHSGEAGEAGEMIYFQISRKENTVHIIAKIGEPTTHHMTILDIRF